MFKQYTDIVTLWRSSKIDLVRGSFNFWPHHFKTSDRPELRGNLLIDCFLQCKHINVILPPGVVVGHLGVNPAPQSGSGSRSIHYLCSTDCHLQNTDVTLSYIKKNSFILFVRANMNLHELTLFSDSQANVLCSGKCSGDRALCGYGDPQRGETKWWTFIKLFCTDNNNTHDIPLFARRERFQVLLYSAPLLLYILLMLIST